MNSVKDKIAMAENHGGKIDNGVKCMVAKYMREQRDMSLVEDTDLSFEVFLATVKDDSYGPLAELMIVCGCKKF